MKICMKLECEEEDLATVQLSNVQLLLQYSTLFCKINDFLWAQAGGSLIPSPRDTYSMHDVWGLGMRL